MPAKTKSNASAKLKTKVDIKPELAEVKPEISIDQYAWTATEWGKFRIEQTRFGLFTSFNAEGEALITGPTEQAVKDCTAMHLHSHTPEGKGLYSVSSKAVASAIDL